MWRTCSSNNFCILVKCCFPVQVAFFGVIDIVVTAAKLDGKRAVTLYGEFPETARSMIEEYRESTIRRKLSAYGILIFVGIYKGRCDIEPPLTRHSSVTTLSPI